MTEIDDYEKGCQILRLNKMIRQAKKFQKYIDRCGSCDVLEEVFRSCYGIGIKEALKLEVA